MTSPASKSCNTAKPYPSARTVSYKGKTGSLLSESDTQKLFTEIQGHSELAFKFPYGGCEVRAPEMTRLILKQEVTPLMGFLEIDDSNSANPRLQYVDPKTKVTYSWKMHQAPVVLVNIKGKTVPYIIDPATQDKAVPFEQWQKTFTQHRKKMKVASEIGLTGQRALGSPYAPDLENETGKIRRDEKLKRLKYFEGQPDGIAQYQAEELAEYEDMNSKLDAMSGGN